MAIVAMVLAWPVPGGAAAPAPLSTLRAIVALTNAQADQAIPVAFEATVTYFRSYEGALFVQNDGSAIFILVGFPTQLAPGDRVLIKGTTRGSFRPIVVARSITVLGHGNLPAPLPATFTQLIRADRDCMFATVRGRVLTANIVMSSGVRSSALRLQMRGGRIGVTINSDNPDELKSLLDAQVEITGAVSGSFDGKMQLTGIVLHVTSLADVKVMQRAFQSPWSLPITPMDRILSDYRVNDLTPRIRVHGTVTYYQPGSALVLQNGSKSLWIATDSVAPVSVGDAADVFGFPDVQNGFLTLTGGEILDRHVRAPITPTPATWEQLALSGNLFDLVSIQGRVVTQVREGAQDEYVLVSGGHLFSAIYMHPPATGLPAGPLPPMRRIPPGSMVRVSGICVMESSDPFNHLVPFNILLRNDAGDIVVIAPPSPLNVRNLIFVIGLLLVAVLLAAARDLLLERKVRRETAVLAYLERRRSRILEQINSARPLEEIVEQITEVVSFRLRGAPCWCETAGGASIGNKPPKVTSQQIVRREIPGHSGTALGAIYAAVDSLAKPGKDEDVALSLGAGLAALAIETSQLYSDLVHRSEYDLLTDLQNRFSVERTLDGLIQAARESGRVFGLVYIDLNEFKQINDLYGHQVGDLYLQEAALRMKRQLRPADTLARLGGDEFTAIVPEVRSRAGVEEIAERLERCFAGPFALEGYVVHGSASIGIALYPEDGTTRDSLLSAADAAMYIAKTARQAEQKDGQTAEGRAIGEPTIRSRT